MGYIENPAKVRVDFFRHSGEWYCTESVKWTGEWEGKKGNIFEAFKQSLVDHFKNRPLRLFEMDAICLHPYHEYKHPIQLKAGSWVQLCS